VAIGDEVTGFLVKHTHRGIGKVVALEGPYLKVKFLETGELATFEKNAFTEKELKYYRLPIKSICDADGKPCIVEKALGKDQSTSLRSYLVTFKDDGLQAEITEDKLLPTGILAAQSIFEKFQNEDPGSYSLFAPREKLLSAIQKQLKSGNGLRALLSSRIDLRPHQAYVAGVVLLDESRRYLLADEVGLGKTIEAGIVIHDLLISKPDARILILCPGALTQQWLCEIYAKFSGHVFRMLEMMKLDLSELPKTQRLIASFLDAGLRHSEKLLSEQWDLVVVDEVHHLLTSQPLYDFVHRLSSATPSILLLSAIPAKRREDEFLKLLTLLEPRRYAENYDSDSFGQLFDNQRSIGRKLRLLRKRLDGLSSGEFTQQEVLEHLQEIASIGVVANDEWVANSVQSMAGQCEDEVVETANSILRHIAENFRINRRILRNRRQRLIEDEQIAEIKRAVETVGYESEQLEYEVGISVSELLRNLQSNQVDPELLEVFAITAWQSILHPQAIYDLLQTLDNAESGRVNQTGREFLRLGYLSGHTSWSVFTGLLCKTIKQFTDADSLDHAISACKKWTRDPASNTRLNVLLSTLKSLKMKNQKVLVFCGYPGTAAKITSAIREKLGNEAVTEFLTELEREEKEANVQRFRDNPETWILVSDESGGEGRNFQFADILIHYDLPWNASRVEQRIGRLDRLGRKLSHVKSIVIYDKTSVESGLLHCLRDGLGIFTSSISGLEFALRSVESQMVAKALQDGREGVEGIVTEVREVVETERERDESDAVLDEASFDRKAAEGFLRVRSSEESEQELEGAFLHFFEMVANRAKPISDSVFPEGIWSFDGDRIHQIRNEFTSQLANRVFKGTFRRAIAQQRIDLEYFVLGNPLFEAIYHSLHVEAIGRTYAIEITKPDIEKKWAGFEYVFHARPNLAALGSNLGLQNRARQYFNFRPVHVFCGLKGTIVEDAEYLLAIRQNLRHDDKDKLWHNFTGHRANQLATLVASSLKSPDWQSTVEDNCTVAKSYARQSCAQFVTPIVGEVITVLESQIANVRHIDSDSKYIQPLVDLRDAISDWDLELDAIGFLSLNMGINERLKNG
jgi:ATP-dependent helicase HepA